MIKRTNAVRRGEEPWTDHASRNKGDQKCPPRRYKFESEKRPNRLRESRHYLRRALAPRDRGPCQHGGPIASRRTRAPNSASKNRHHPTSNSARKRGPITTPILHDEASRRPPRHAGHHGSSKSTATYTRPLLPPPCAAIHRDRSQSAMTRRPTRPRPLHSERLRPSPLNASRQWSVHSRQSRPRRVRRPNALKQTDSHYWRSSDCVPKALRNDESTPAAA